VSSADGRPAGSGRRRRLVLALGILASAVGVGIVAMCRIVPDSPLDCMPLVEAKHPGVPWISTASLARALEDGDPPVLLDVRSRAEFRTSHIEGARHVEPGSDPSAVELPPARHVVVYCSVGFRSADFARKLRPRGVAVHNLAGGIFQWANEKRPMVDSGRSTDRVHPYDEVWGRLVDPELRAPVP